MKDTRTASSHSRSPRRYRRRTAGGELLQLIRAIQELTLELAQLRHEEHAGPELEAKERTLEQLRWRLAALARRLATEDFGAAA
jgi:hypothetical protein